MEDSYKLSIGLQLMETGTCDYNLCNVIFEHLSSTLTQILCLPISQLKMFLTRLR